MAETRAATWQIYMDGFGCWYCVASDAEADGTRVFVLESEGCEQAIQKNRDHMTEMQSRINRLEFQRDRAVREEVQWAAERKFEQGWQQMYGAEKK